MAKYWLFYIRSAPGLWEFMQANGIAAQHYPRDWFPPSARGRNLKILERISIGDGIVGAIGQHRFVGYGRVRSPFNDSGDPFRPHSLPGECWAIGWCERIGVDWIALPLRAEREFHAVPCDDLNADGYQVNMQRSCCANEIDVRSFAAIAQRLDESGATPLLPGKKVGTVTANPYTDIFRHPEIKLSIESDF